MYESGMKVCLYEMYCDVKEDGITRGSSLRYVVENLGGGHYLLADTKRSAHQGRGRIYDQWSIKKSCGWWI